MTLRLHRATLRHRMALPDQSWHSQVSQGGAAGRSPGLGETGARAGAGPELTLDWSWLVGRAPGPGCGGQLVGSK